MKKSAYQKLKDKIAILEEKNRQIRSDLYKIAGITECPWVERQELIMKYRHHYMIYDAMFKGEFVAEKLMSGIFQQMKDKPFVYSEPKITLTELNDTLPEKSFVESTQSCILIDQGKIGKQIEEKWANCSHNYIAFHKTNGEGTLIWHCNKCGHQTASM